MVKFKVVFTLSDAPNLRRDLNWSLPACARFIKKEDIIVFLTPPVTFVKKNQKLRKQWIKQLRTMATVKEVPLLTRPFIAFRRRGGGAWYGEKAHLCDVKARNVVFLDCDCHMIRDISPLVKGKFDFSARVDRLGMPALDIPLFKKMFKNIGKKYIPMPNAGFLIFKNYCHKKIKDDWTKYVNDPDLPNPHTEQNTKEQYCLAMAVSGYRIRWLKDENYLFYPEIKEWYIEKNPNLYVVHTKSNVMKKMKSLKKLAVHGKGWH